MEICKTDVRKIIQYLDDAAKLYDALPMQKCKCRAHMIKQLIVKLKKKEKNEKVYRNKTSECRTHDIGRVYRTDGA